MKNTESKTPLRCHQAPADFTYVDSINQNYDHLHVIAFKNDCVLAIGTTGKVRFFIQANGTVPCYKLSEIGKIDLKAWEWFINVINSMEYMLILGNCDSLVKHFYYN